jgi:Diacylglycerol kinase catalytic domain
VGWFLGSLRELYESKREPVPPTGIIPLGTGNDLSRTFGWVCVHYACFTTFCFIQIMDYSNNIFLQGGSFPFAWRSALKQLLYKAVTAPICRLDRQVLFLVPDLVYHFIWFGYILSLNFKKYRCLILIAGLSFHTMMFSLGHFISFSTFIPSMLN